MSPAPPPPPTQRTSSAAPESPASASGVGSLGRQFSAGCRLQSFGSTSSSPVARHSCSDGPPAARVRAPLCNSDSEAKLCDADSEMSQLTSSDRHGSHGWDIGLSLGSGWDDAAGAGHHGDRSCEGLPRAGDTVACAGSGGCSGTAEAALFVRAGAEGASGRLPPASFGGAPSTSFDRMLAHLSDTACLRKLSLRGEMGADRCADFVYCHCSSLGVCALRQPAGGAYQSVFRQIPRSHFQIAAATVAASTSGVRM